MFHVKVTITLRPSILDVQGNAIKEALFDLGISSVKNVRTGKSIDLHIDTNDEQQAYDIAQRSCQAILANSTMEDYHIKILKNKADS